MFINFSIIYYQKVTIRKLCPCRDSNSGLSLERARCLAATLQGLNKKKADSYLKVVLNILKIN